MKNIYAWLSLCSSLICFLLANFIFYNNNKRKENWLFILFCLSVMYWGFVEFMLRQATDECAAYFWLQMHVSWPFAITFIFHFILYYTEKTKLIKNIFFNLLLYIPPCVCAYLDSTTTVIANKVVKKYWGYTYLQTEGSIAGIIINVWMIILLSLTIGLCLHYYWKTSSKIKKMQTRLLLVGISIPIVIGLLTERLLAGLKIEFPQLSVTSTSLMAIILTYAIWRFELFIISPNTTAENIISTMPDALLLLDLDQKIVKVNKSFINLFGYKEYEIIGKPVSLLTKNDAAIKTFLLELYSGKILSNIETELRNKSNNDFFAIFSASPIIDKYQQIRGVVSIIRDISEQKMAAQELKKAEYKMLELAHQAGMAEVAAEILHNMGNTLNSISISAEEVYGTIRNSKLDRLIKANELMVTHKNDIATYLANDPKGKILLEYYSKVCAELKNEHTKIKNEATQLLDKIAIIKDIIEMQQGYTHKIVFTEKIDLSIIVEEALRIQAVSFSRHRIRLEKKYLKENLIVEIQHSKLIHILINLFRNAIEAMEVNELKTRLLSIEIGQYDNNKAYINITDNGEGITGQNLNNIFSFGFTTKKKGHGFGLHSCANAMSEMGGKIFAASDGPGTGATFTLIFNLVQAREQVIQ